MLESLFSRFSIRRFFSIIGAAFAALLAAVGALSAYLYFSAPDMDFFAAAAFAVLALLLLLFAALVFILLAGGAPKTAAARALSFPRH